MLDELAVANLGILEDARIEPGPGLVVVSGETGAGKTLLLGALRLLLGASGRKDQIGPHGDELRVEGRFVFGDEEAVAARRITASRGRAYFDGSMVPARVLAERIAEHVEIVGQHDALSLSDGAVIRSLIDANLDKAGLGALAAYEAAYERHEELLERQAELGGDLRSIEREIEMLEHQAGEIDSAAFSEGEDELLQATAGRLRNAGAITEALGSALVGLEDDRGVVDALGSVTDALLRASRLDPTLETSAKHAVELVDSAATLAGELRRSADEIDHDGNDLDKVEQRLLLLSGLRRKYGESLDAVLAFGRSAQERARELRSLVEDAAGLVEAIAKSRDELDRAGGDVTSVRTTTAARIAAAASTHLLDLGFTDPEIAFEFAAVPPGRHGTDRISLVFASDTSLAAAPVARSASGGELSRLVLSVRLAAATSEAAVLAFDEIDAGLGGSTAFAMGAKLATLAHGRQVLCVTHLPQVAAFADQHYVIDRDGATATVRLVEGEARVSEITRMLSGLTGSETGQDHATELLETAISSKRG